MFWNKKMEAPTKEEYNVVVDALNLMSAEKGEIKTKHETELKQIRHDNEIKVSKLESEHEIALKEKEFDLKHFKDEDVQKSQAEATDLKQKNAVLENENKMLREITNLNADIIDIKDLVASLIKKLPNIDLKSITVQNTGGSK